MTSLYEVMDYQIRARRVSSSVFYAQSAITVIAGRRKQDEHNDDINNVTVWGGGLTAQCKKNVMTILMTSTIWFANSHVWADGVIDESKKSNGGHY